VSLTQAIIKRIFELCDKHDLTVGGLANLCAVPPSTLKSILYCKSKNPRIVVVKMICDGLDMTLAEFFDTEYFNCLDPIVK
jgi:transcriptional regulator with XRE-family HTH domain